MCGRFELHTTPSKIKEHFDLTGELNFSPSWNITPATLIHSIVADEEEKRHLRLMHWGLIPSWAKDRTIATRLINARSESITDKPSFRNAFKRRRCIIPASGFYEWKKSEDNKKQPWYISLISGEPIALAGLWEHWTSKEGDEIQSCCIITTSANQFMQSIHDRMPVILSEDQWALWLSQKEQSPDKVLPFLYLQKYKLPSMQAWPVTRELNRAGYRNDAQLIEKLSE